LPKKFANIQLFSTVNLYDADDSISLNFGKHKWQFEDFKRFL